MRNELENRMVVDSQWHHEKPVCQCEECELGIYEDEEYFDFNGDIVCEDCVMDYVRMNYKKTATRQREFMGED